jgi:hypothetical protein
MIISGNNQNFFRLIAKRQSWPTICTFGLRFDLHWRKTNPDKVSRQRLEIHISDTLDEVT